MSVLVHTLKKMVTYPLSGIVYVSILILLVVVGCQNVPIFPDKDLTLFDLPKYSGTRL